MNSHLKKLTTASVFAAVIFLATWLLKIPLPYGYAHLGDALIFSLALFLPLPYGIGASCVGACLADIASGYAIYAPFTFIIKPLCLTLFFLFKKNESRLLRFFIPSLIAAVLNLSLYFAADMLLIDPSAAILALPGNLMQAAVSVILFNIITAISKKYHI